MAIIEQLKKGNNTYDFNKKFIVISYFVHWFEHNGHYGFINNETNQSISSFPSAGLYFFDTENNKLYITTGTTSTSYTEITNVNDYIYFTQEEINQIFQGGSN